MNIKMRERLLYPLFSFMTQIMSLLGAVKNNKKEGWKKGKSKLSVMLKTVCDCRKPNSTAEAAEN